MLWLGALPESALVCGSSQAREASQFRESACELGASFKCVHRVC